jgi:toxin ParE1/3/4
MPGENSRIIWAPAAKKDLRDIWRYFADVASLEVADRLLGDIKQVSERVRRQPLTWRSRDEIKPGLHSILIHPYVLFYQVKPGAVEVVRVVHQRRNFAAIFLKPKS